MAENTEKNEFVHRQPINDLNDDLCGLILSVRELEYRIAEDNLNRNQVKEAFAELYPPAALFSTSIQALPAIYPAILNCFNENSAALTPHSSRNIKMTLATQIYTEKEDKEAATEILKGIIAANRRRNNTKSTAVSTVVSTEAPSSTAIASKVARNLAMRFRSDKFTGDIGESWNEYVREYQQVARDYGLGNQEKLQYLHSIIEGTAKRFYLNTALPHVNSYAHAVDLIGKEYNSLNRQTRIKNVLSVVSSNACVIGRFNKTIERYFSEV